MILTNRRLQRIVFEVRRHPSALVGMVLVTLLIFVVVFAPFIASHDPIRQDLPNKRLSPSWNHYLGTDEFGRDIFSRIVFGARLTLLCGLISVGLGLLLGVPAGLVAGYGNRHVDVIVSSVLDTMLAYPSLLLALAVTCILGPGLVNAMIAIGIVYAPRFGRLVRGLTLAAKQQDYVFACRALSCSHARIVLRHILPNCLAPLLVISTLNLAGAILEAAALSFLGLGAQPPSPEWGAMLHQGWKYLRTAPHRTLFPGLAILVSVLGVNLIGDGLRDIWGRDQG
ncbi:MAG: ABC transporter permease [bacterium]